MIGHLNSPHIGLTAKFSFGVDAQPPFQDENGYIRWSWEKVTGADVMLEITLPHTILLSGVYADLAPECHLEQAELLDEDGRCIGAYRAETGKFFGGNIQISTFAKGHTFRLCLRAAMTDIALRIPELYGATIDLPTRGDLPHLFPTPSCVEWKSGAVPFTALTTANAAEQSDARFALDHFTALAEDRLALAVKDGHFFTILTDASLPKESYRLTIDTDGVRLCGADRLGLLYGVERLFELEKDGSLPCCHIEDRPYKAMRGVHMYLPHPNKLTFARRLIQNVFIPCHYNHIILEIAGGMRYDSHPEISEGWLSGNRLAREGKIPPFPHGSVAGGELLEKQDVRELCDFIRSLGLDVIPEVQSFGHVQYITYVHPEIAEIDPQQAGKKTDERDADVPPSLFYHHSYCPQNEKSYAIIFDLLDEIIDTVRPTAFVHMGHDEIYQLGLCPKCKGIAPDVLYEKHVRAMHDHLAEKGLRMMLWADMVQPVSKYGCYPALQRLPRDIVWLDFIWYFHFDKDIEDNLLPHGYELMVGNLYSSHFPRYESRMAKSGMIGGQLSFWSATNEESLAREGKLYDLMYTAEMLCCPDYCHRARSVYAAIIADRLSTIRGRLRGKREITEGFCSMAQRHKLFAARPTYTEFDALCTENGIHLLSATTVPVMQKTLALRFLHGATHRDGRIAWKPLIQVGSYTVEYEDGTALDIPVTYGGNVRYWKEAFAEPLTSKYYRHEGYIAAWEADPVTLGHTADGLPATLYSLYWENPHPEKAIKQISFRELAESRAGMVLCDILVAEQKE